MRLRNRSVFGDGGRASYIFKLKLWTGDEYHQCSIVCAHAAIWRKYINIGTIIISVVAGVLIDAFNAALIALFPNLDLFGQTLMLIAGFLLFAAGTGIYIVAALGVGGVEFITLSFSEKTKINLRWVRIGFDVICMILGIVLGAIAGRGIFGDLIGVGTILGRFGTGVVMKFTIRLLDERLTKWFGPLRRKAEAF